MEGEWVDRTAIFHGRRTTEGASPTERDCTTIETVKLAPIGSGAPPHDQRLLFGPRDRPCSPIRLR